VQVSSSLQYTRKLYAAETAAVGVGQVVPPPVGRSCQAPPILPPFLLR